MQSPTDRTSREANDECQCTYTYPEEWRPVPNYEGIYEVSNHGRVKSLERIVKIRTGGERKYGGIILKPQIGSHGYRSVCLFKDKKPRQHTIHALVLSSFQRSKKDGEVCRHLDGNQLNNHTENIVWGSYRENGKDAVRHGRNVQANQTHCIREHILMSPNLCSPRSNRDPAQRECLSCARAWAYISHHQLSKEVLQEVSDSYYQQIMSGGGTSRGAKRNGGYRHLWVGAQSVEDAA